MSGRKKMLSLLLSVVMMLSPFATIGASADSGLVGVASNIFSTPTDLITDGDYEYGVLEDETAYIAGYNGYNEEGILNIPETLGDREVTAIGDYVFWDEGWINEITIPDSVTYIGRSAFTNTGYYNNVQNWDNNLLYIGNYLISAYNDFDDLHICFNEDYCVVKEGTKAIADGAFDLEECNEVNYIYIPSSVKYIGYFWGSFEEIVYAGTEQDWQRVVFEKPNYENYYSIHYEGTANTISKTNVVQPTCSKDGSYDIYCDICQEIKQSVIDYNRSDHTKGALLYKKPATCGEPGYSIYRCATCNNMFETDYTDPTFDHNYVFSRTVAPTCETEGYDEHRCTNCGWGYRDNYQYSERYMDGSGHEKGTLIESVAPSCVNYGEGYNTYTCLHCSGTVYEYFSGDFNHNYVVIENVAPSCINGGEGYIRYECTACGETYREWYTGSYEHNYVYYRTITQTCTQNGYDEYKCTVCERTTRRNYNYCLGHIQGALISSKVNTDCLGPAYKEYRCVICNQNYKDFDNEDYYGTHNFVNGSCSVCKVSQSNVVESAHNYANNFDYTWVITRKANLVKVTFSDYTYTEEGCDYIRIYDANDTLIGEYDGDELAGKTIEVAGNTVKIRLTTDGSVRNYGFSTTKIEAVCYHKSYATTVVKAATCKEVGTANHRCTTCGYSYQTQIAKIAHKNKVTGAKAATYFATGSTGKTVCSVCNVTISNAKTVAKKVLKKPSATIKAGSKKITVKYAKVTDATGFQIRYRVSGAKKWTTKTYTSKKTVTKTIKSLKKGKKYNVQVRAMVKSGSKKAYSSWTKTKTVTVK